MLTPSPNPQESQCRWCGRKVFWLNHERTGKRAPIDAYPSPNGNVGINQENGTYRIITAQMSLEDMFSTGRYTNHWATCPEAGEHR